MAKPRVYKITTDKGQVLNAGQLSACIMAGMGISTVCRDITEEYEQGTISKPDKQEIGKSASIPNGGSTQVDGNKDAIDRKPVA